MTRWNIKRTMEFLHHLHTENILYNWDQSPERLQAWSKISTQMNIPINDLQKKKRSLIASYKRQRNTPEGSKSLIVLHLNRFLSTYSDQELVSIMMKEKEPPISAAMLAQLERAQPSTSRSTSNVQFLPNGQPKPVPKRNKSKKPQATTSNIQPEDKREHEIDNFIEVIKHHLKNLNDSSWLKVKLDILRIVIIASDLDQNEDENNVTLTL